MTKKIEKSEDKSPTVNFSESKSPSKQGSVKAESDSARSEGVRDPKYQCGQINVHIHYIHLPDCDEMVSLHVMCQLYFQKKLFPL